MMPSQPVLYQLFHIDRKKKKMFTDITCLFVSIDYIIKENRIVQNAQREWMEEEETVSKKHRTSTTETATIQEEHYREQEAEGTAILRTATQSQQRQPMLGTGVTAMID